MKYVDLSGKYEVTLDDGSSNIAYLPGTLDENQIGHKDSDNNKWHPDVELAADATCNPVLNSEGIISGRLTRKYTYEGKASFRRSFSFDCQRKNENIKRVFLYIERSRKLTAVLNGKKLSEYIYGTLSTPWIYEVTDIIENSNELCLISDNSYQGWPAAAIKYSSAASDESQTNWNGIIGNIGLVISEESFIQRVSVYPKKNTVDVSVILDSAQDGSDLITVQSKAFRNTEKRRINYRKGINRVDFLSLPLRLDCSKWDEYEGNLYCLKVEGNNFESKQVEFGIRDFSFPRSPYLTLNGRRIFLRCETNVGLFPEEGHSPMSEEKWRRYLKLYHSYGVNAVRFHSWCPPESLFSAADKEGMIIQVELSNWDPYTAFESDESFSYYKKELAAILDSYSNHPSFCMLTLGNELHCDEKGLKRMNALIEYAIQRDSTRLYAIASNPFYGDQGTDGKSDFFTASGYLGEIMRGTSAGMKGKLNQGEPSTYMQYDDLMNKIRQNYTKPVFAFEAGQYEILPDFHEIERFKGVLLPDNITAVRNYASDKGMTGNWDKKVEASGELALIAYREEVEAVMRTSEMSGISILGLQDFTGQGTALIGMLNSHLEPKPFDFAKSQRFSKFFCRVLPLLLLKSRTYTKGEIITIGAAVANYGKEDICSQVKISLIRRKNAFSENDETVFCSTYPEVTAAAGGLSKIGKYSISLENCTAPAKYDLRIDIGMYCNIYPVWVYPEEEDNIRKIAGKCNVVITSEWADSVRELRKGRNVLYSPKADIEHFDNSIRTCFTTDLWSVGTYTFQEGYMGILVESNSPVFESFPTDFHSDWQWYRLTVNSRAMIISYNEKPLIEALDSYARLRKLSFCSEYRMYNGKLIVSSMGLMEKQKYPEAKAMLKSILLYMNSEKFNPEKCIDEKYE